MGIGIVREMGYLGRLTIPKETRESLGIGLNESVEIYTDEKGIMLKKYEAGCIICKSMEGLEYFNGKRICRECISKL